ncbi:uncharacterized protein LOC142333730 [Lycorma delicatula]|uniref:uncharacterized protein LOC142333730 n=1 Tax=Lycorma delicatula TaxID=130591 RepID=UPI003F50D704
MPELSRSCSTDHSEWNIDKNNRSYIDPWDLENYVYMKRRLSMNVVSFNDNNNSIIQTDGEPITSLSAKSDFYYVKPPPPPSRIPPKKSLLPMQPIKTIRRQSLIQEVSPGIDEQHFSNGMYNIYYNNDNNNQHRCHQNQYYQRNNNYNNKPTRRHSSITYMQFCQHQQQNHHQQMFRQNHHHLPHFHQNHQFSYYPNLDDIYGPDPYYGSTSTSGFNSWQKYDKSTSPSSLRHQDTPQSSLTSSTTSPIPPKLLYLYQRRRVSNLPHISNYRQRSLAPIITEMRDEKDNYHVVHGSGGSSINSTSSGATSGSNKTNQVDDNNNNNDDIDEDTGTIIYHDDISDGNKNNDKNKSVIINENVDNVDDNEDDADVNINLLTELLQKRFQKLSKQPKHFGLSTFGHLKIDYSNNWSNLDRYIGNS